MKLVKKLFKTVEEGRYWIDGLSKAINTTYLPCGSTIEEVIASFLKIQLSRSFNNSSLGSAWLQMTLNEEALTFSYSSTSDTCVFIQYAFDSNMQFKVGILECDIPSERVGTGRCHYEAITHFVYGDWKKEVVPEELVAINEDLNVKVYPTPDWVLENLANCQAKENPAEQDAQLLALGYLPIANPIGFKKVWYSFPIAMYNHIVQSDTNKYFLLKEGESIDRIQGVSYKRLLEILKNPPKSKRQRKFSASLTIEEMLEESES
jgi:hypothetical protein